MWCHYLTRILTVLGVVAEGTLDNEKWPLSLAGEMTNDRIQEQIQSAKDGVQQIVSHLCQELMACGS